jgi:hypothetical protein
MFDIKSEIYISARVQSSGNKLEEIGVRWPTDEEWGAYLRSKRFNVRQLGRGVSETIPPAPGEADVQLCQKIALNGMPTLTPAEASKLLDTLSISQVTSVKLEGLEAAVEMRVLGGTVKHTMRIPTADQASLYRRSAVRRLDLTHNQQHAIFNQGVAAKIYDDCGGRSDDYADGAIPMPHKHEVARSVLEEIDLEYGPKDDESF